MRHMFLKATFVAPLVLFFLFPLFSNAASLYIDPPYSTLYRGDTVTLSVRLDTDESIGECVNAVDGIITYSSNIEPVDVSIGSSIFSIWVETPTINRNDRTITFAGGIPNGYCGRVEGDPRLTNTLAQIIFRSPGFSIGGSGETEAVVSLTENSTVYLNDGQGTRVMPTTYPARMVLNQTASTSLTNPWQGEVDSDKTPPNEFSIELIKDDAAFYKNYFIVFNTTDKETGISHYEIMEEPLSQVGDFQWGRADAPWIIGVSPYELKDQTLNSTIRVKAVDKAGNEYIATLIPEESMRTFSTSQIIFSITFTMMFVAFAFMLASLLFLFVRNKRKNKSSLEENLSNQNKIEENTLTEDDIYDNK